MIWVLLWCVLCCAALFGFYGFVLNFMLLYKVVLHGVGLICVGLCLGL